MTGLSLRRDAEKKPALDIDAIVHPDSGAEKKTEPPCRVLLHNDDVTPIDYVPRVLQRVFRIGAMRALWITMRAHVARLAQVVVEPCAKAEALVAEAHEMARGDGHIHLTFSVEPTEE